MRSDIAEIRERVALLRAALLSPGVDALLGCIPTLEEAAARLARLDPQALDADERAEVSLLKHDLLRVQSLAADGLAFWEGWARAVGAAAGVSTGYGSSGEGADLTRRSKVEVTG